MTTMRLAWSPAAIDAGFFALNLGVLLFLVEPRALLLFFLCCLIALRVRARLRGRAATAWTALSIVLLTGLLLAYRLSSLLAGRPVPGFGGALQLPVLDALGVSYCWLRAVYALGEPRMTPWEFARYYFFFPTFTSGPVLKPGEFLPQRARWDREEIVQGAARIAFGGMKFAAAALLQVAVPVSTAARALASVDRYPPPALWLALVAAGLWLYLNFSAFTDFAIGLARLFGLRVPENFNNPYAARNLTDFWRRWHITLGDWLRINVFNPAVRGLGARGASQALAATASVLLTMLVCGLWHRTTLPFVVWGLMHGAGLAAHYAWQGSTPARRLGGALGERGYGIFAWLLTHAYVTLAWAFFFPVGMTSLALHWVFVRRLFGL
jgi:alginate O-acetyltransferase complex protein AlgI